MQSLDAQIVAYVSLFHKNLDALPYKFYDLLSGGKEYGHFTLLTTQDGTTVQNWVSCAGPWSPGCSAFYSVWCDALQKAPSSLLKFYSSSDLAGAIKGLIRLDHNKPCADQSLRVLETAPEYQSGVSGRRYAGIGTALVARLILDCYWQGQQTLFIRVHPRNIPFYVSLGFISSPRVYGRLALDLQDGERFLKNFFF